MMKLTRVAQAVALVSLAGYGLAQAQTAPAPAPAPKEAQKLERVTVTGSSIKRLADEKAMPIETYNRSQIEQLGISTADQLVELLAANVAGANNPVSTNTVFGPDQDRLTGGANNANLRGLGPTGTLVLLNGRRVSTHGMSGGSVDLNAIPMDAIERVETLKDGASAVYGTDAIGGVINFITRTSYEGLALRGTYSAPEASGGGQSARVSATAGMGNLSRDGWNLMASVAYDDSKILRGRDRDWATGFQPARGLSPDSTSAAHANIVGSAGTLLGSTATTGALVGSDPTRYTNLNLMAVQGRCQDIPDQVPMAPNITLWDKFGYTNANSRYRCTRDYGRNFMLRAPREALNALIKGTMDFGEHRFSLELIGSRTNVEGEYSPFQFTTNAGGTAAASGSLPAVTIPATNLQATSPHYQTIVAALQQAGVSGLNVGQPIVYRLNMTDWGFRLNENRSDNLRAQATLDGQIWGLDYSVGVGVGSAEASTYLRQGYTDAKKLVTLLASGQYNPFLLPGQQQSEQVKAAIEDMQARGRVFGGKTSVKQADATLSGPLGNFMAGSLDFAVGLNFRQESYEFSGTQTFQCVSGITAAVFRDNNVFPVLGCPGNASSPKLSRDIAAVFGELVVRPAKSLELTLQARHDEYQSIGGTTNPKVGLKFTPNEMLLIRASANTGFRAPTPQQIKLGSVELNLTGTFRDPVLCADINNPVDPTQCNRSALPFRQGGNPTLQPEESDQHSGGFVFAPTRELQFYADYWQVKLKDRIRQLSPANMIANYALFEGNFIRDPATGRVNYIQAGWINAADSKTRGVDFGMQHSTELFGGRVSTSFSGTRMISHKERALKNAPMVEYQGKWTNTALYLPWRLNASVGYRTGPWNTTLSVAHRDSYEDEDRTPYTANQPTTREIDAYTTWNLVSSYSGIKGVTLSASVINVFDKQPPFTWHNADGVIGAGWDPRIADPRGRTFSISASWRLQ